MIWRPNTKLIGITTGILALAILIHLIGVYIYSGGHYEGVKGGSISIGIIDDTPSPMNPFQYGKDSSVDFVYRFLFRGLIRYDIRSEVYTGDLASCDIADVAFVKCRLNTDAVWSDGTKVQLDDVIQSIKTFAKSSPSGEIRSFLAGVTINANKDVIEIKSNTKSPQMIEILTYPIVRTDVIELIRSGRIGTNTYVTSGPFILGEIEEKDKTYGFDRITLFRNDKWKGPVWLDKIHFKFFKDQNALTRGSEALTIVIPPARNESLDFGPRFQEYKYSNFEYFSVFFNTSKLSRSLRNNLHWQIGNMLSEYKNPNTHTVNNIFNSTGKLLPTEKMKNFPDVMKELGYLKKSSLIKNLEQSGSVVSGEVQFDKAKYWSNKAGVKILLVNDPATELTLRGTIPNTTQSVTINNYTLKEYSAGTTTFVYKVSIVDGTLVEGKNTYTLKLDLGGGKVETEDLIVFWSPDITKVDAYKKELQDTYNASQNTPALIADRERIKAGKLEELKALSDEYYYNDKGEIFSLKVGYVNGVQSTESYANETDKALRLLGVKTELIAYTPKDIQTIITSGKKDYDLLIIGVTVNGSIANLGQMFGASSSGSNLNFSGYTNKSLDALFGELRSTTEPIRISQIEQEIMKIMNTESFFMPIASPYHRILIDRNIKGIAKIDTLPSIPSFSTILQQSSIKEKYILDTKDKSIGGFFSWLTRQF